MTTLESDMEAVANMWLTGDSSDDEFIEHLELLGCSHFEALEHFEDYGGDFKEAAKRTLEMLSGQNKTLKDGVVYFQAQIERLERDKVSLVECDTLSKCDDYIAHWECNQYTYKKRTIGQDSIDDEEIVKKLESDLAELGFLSGQKVIILFNW